MNKLVLAAASAAVVFCSSDAQAKTVALWPLNNGNTRCAIDPRNDFKASSLVTYSAEQTIGWNLPPNADSNVTDAATYLFDPINRGEVIYDYNKAQLDAKSEHLWSLLDLGPGKQFTLEGYFKLSALVPETKVQTKIIANVNGGTANRDGGWSLNYYSMVTQTVDKVKVPTYHIFRMEGNGWQLNFDSITDEEVVGLTNGWNHFAVVFKYQSETVANSSDWTVYFNGRSLGTKQKRLNFAPERNYASIRIGHHLSANDDRTAYGRFCYWRLSDTALAPSEFLNYDPEGKGGTLVPEPPPAQPERTVAYWKFNSMNGVADVRDSVGQAHLLALHANNRGSTEAANMMCPSEESAFDGNPPNKTVTFPDGNHGSFYVPSTRIANICITQQDLGATLDITNSFTVEGWIKPRRRTGTDFNAQQAWMFGNMPLTSYRGWVMGMLMSGGRRYLAVYAYNRVDGQTSSVINTAIGSCTFCDITDWGEDWRHLALTYDCTGGEQGFGEWTLYMNGVQMGKVANVSAVLEPDSGKASKNFYIGGTFNGAFAGCYDAVRVSQGVLAPKQFLCYGGDDAEEATGVLATWPLNVTAGTGLGGANLEGGYNIFNRETDFPEGYYLTKTDDAKAPNAAIPNPDQSLAFDGDATVRSTNSGSVGFCAGADHDFGWLATNDKTVIGTLRSEAGWTLEGWVNYDDTNGGIQWTGFGPVFALGNSLGQNDLSYRLEVWNKTGYSGRVFYQGLDPYGTAAGSPAVTPQLKAKTWYHLAVVHSYFTDTSGDAPVKMSRMAYYLDGMLQTNVDLVAKATISTINWLIFGSNTNGSRGFPGFVNSWRLSRGQLDPSELLCAAAETPVPPTVEKKTLAYWPLDRNEDGSLNVEAKAGVPGYVLSVADDVSATNGDIVASTDRARRRVPNKTVEFDRANIGSLVTDGAYLRADYLGARLDLDTAWTVEGWIRPDADGGNEVRTIAGTYVEEKSPYGWKLMMQPGTVGPTFSLRAQPAGCTPNAEGAFARAADSAAAWAAGKWNHVALTFDPNAGRGTWTLYLNGKAYGSIENTWRNLTLKTNGTFFQFGTYEDSATPSFFGGYDMWRVSTGLLTPEEMLYRDPLGALLLLR